MINFGIVGTNIISHQFINAGLIHKHFNAVAVYSRKEETAKQFSNSHKSIKFIYTDLLKMATDKKIDAVYIASPNSFHKKQAEIFLKNNIPVFLEKPMVSNSKEAVSLFETSKKHNTLLMEGLRNVFEPRLKAVYSSLSKIGKIRRVVADFSQYSSRYNNFKNGIIENAFNKDFSNGAIMDIGIYLLEPVIQTFGMPNEVKGVATILKNSIDGQGSLLLNYDNMQASLTFSKITNGYQPTEIQGEDGVLIFHRNLKEKETAYIIYNNGKKEVINFEQTLDPMYYEIEEFINLIKTNKTFSSLLKPENTISTFKVIDEYRKQVGLIFPCDN